MQSQPLDTCLQFQLLCVPVDDKQTHKVLLLHTRDLGIQNCIYVLAKTIFLCTKCPLHALDLHRRLLNTPVQIESTEKWLEGQTQSS